MTAPEGCLGLRVLDLIAYEPPVEPGVCRACRWPLMWEEGWVLRRDGAEVDRLCDECFSDATAEAAAGGRR